ncbi:MAG: hypothetical protein A2046_16485 [Bacteroidetes bacterium GWA2_30_7]|nr:MAG: hypothetical protein A2046_16485 [Bacteroidetes bacterium GWA2_30_7]
MKYLIFSISAFIIIFLILIPLRFNSENLGKHYFDYKNFIIINDSISLIVKNDSINCISGTYLGNYKRNFYGNNAPENLTENWKLFLGHGQTVVSAKEGKKSWYGAGWTGQPLIIRENDKYYLIQGAFDHKLKKIDLQTQTIVWEYEFDDVIKGTGTFWLNPENVGIEEKYVIFQGSRKGTNTRLFDEFAYSYRAISYITGKEIWRTNVRRTLSYSRDVDASALIHNNKLYIPMENGILTVINPAKRNRNNTTNYFEPEIIRETKLFTNSDALSHFGNLVTESSPCILGERLYIAAGSGHLYGYNLMSDSIEWDLFIGSDIDGSPVVTNDSCLIITIEKQYINGNGGCFKIDPSKSPDSSIVWFFPTQNKRFAKWDGGITGTASINDYYHQDSSKNIVAISAIDGYLYVFHNSYLQENKKVKSPFSDAYFNCPKEIFKYYIGPSISTPIITDNKLIACSYLGTYLFEYNNLLELKLKDYKSGIFEATPVIFNKNIYVASRDGYLYCFGNSDSTQTNGTCPIVNSNKALLEKTPKSAKTYTETTNKYLIIGGTFKTHERAEIFEKILTERGFENNIIGPLNGNYYNVLNSFSTKNESINEIQKLNSLGNKQVWVLKQ